MKTLRLARVAASPARKGRMQSRSGNASATPIPRKTCRRLKSQRWERMLAIVVLLIRNIFYSVFFPSDFNDIPFSRGTAREFPAVTYHCGCYVDNDGDMTTTRAS